MIVLSCLVTGEAADAAEPPGPIPPLPGLIAAAPVLPDDDPFYRAPAGLDAIAPGTVLRSRQVAVTGPTALAPAAYQVLFRSTDARGAPIAAAATVLLPAVPAPGPRRLVSYQVFEDSLTTGCAPSYTMRSGSGLPQPVENALITTVLAQGWSVVVPDHEGPRSELAIGPLGGRITLDATRAAERFGPAGLDGARTPVALMGYSGGSTPTLWADALAPRYAPELNVVGAATGGVLTDLDGVMRAHGEPPVFGAVLVLGVALDRAYGIGLPALLTDRGRAAADDLGRDGHGCLGALSAVPLDGVRSDTRFPAVDRLVAEPRLATALRQVDLVAAPALHAPTLVVHGVQDELIPVASVDTLVAANCRRGASVDYRRLPGEHFATTAPYQVAALAYLADRFRGSPAPSTCGAGSPGTS